MKLNRLGFTLSASAAAACAVRHVATFVTAVPGLLLVPPFFLFAGAVFCARATQTASFTTNKL